jgi:hypothetical protein
MEVLEVLDAVDTIIYGVGQAFGTHQPTKDPG